MLLFQSQTFNQAMNTKSDRNVLLANRLTSVRLAFTLIETVMSTVLVSILLVTSLSTMSYVQQSANAESHSTAAPRLAQFFLTEITSKPFHDPDNNGTNIGLSQDETGSPRTGWDDCDDYHGLSLTTLIDSDGNVIPDSAGWILQVTVQYAEPTAPLTAVSFPTDLKLVTVFLTDPGGTTHTFRSFRSLNGPIQQGQSTSVLSSIEMKMQTAGQTSVVSTRILNQQEGP